MDAEDSRPDAPPPVPDRPAREVNAGAEPGSSPADHRGEAHGSTPTRQGDRAEQPKGGRLKTVLVGGPPPGPTRPGFWRSPIRGPWLTSVFGLVLLIGIPVMFVTGLLSYAAYNPDLAAVNDQTPDKGWLGFYLFSWPTDPSWLYRLNQGVHVTLGVVLVPVLLAKLWSVIPRLFSWPPVRSVAHALERLSLLLLVGGALFEFVTGLLNVQLHYVFPGSFYTLHFYGAWVFIGAFVVHIAFRIPVMARALRSRRLRTELRTDTAATRPEPPDATGLVSPRPAPATMSRRGALGTVGLGSLVLLAVTAGQSIGGSLRRTALLAPHGQEPGSGPNGFQINKTAASVGIRAADIGPQWRLVGRGPGHGGIPAREQVPAPPQPEAALPVRGGCCPAVRLAVREPGRGAGIVDGVLAGGRGGDERRCGGVVEGAGQPVGDPVQPGDAVLFLSTGTGEAPHNYMLWELRSVSMISGLDILRLANCIVFRFRF